MDISTTASRGTTVERAHRNNTFAKNSWYVLRRWPVVPIIVLSTLVFVAIFAPVLAPHSWRLQDLRARNAPPAWLDSQWYEERPLVEHRYILGADHVGRDVLSRMIHGARISLVVAGISLVSGLTVGTVLALVAGYFGRHLDEIVMRIVDIWLALPFILIALVVNVTIGTGFAIVLALLALIAWSAFVRNIRAEVLSVKTRDYISLARIAGASHFRILARHILPQVTNTMVVIATLQVGNLIMAEAALSFLGAGIPPPTPAWGVMVADGREHLATAWWIAIFPSLAIFLVVMSLNFMGDWLRDRFDPRLRQL